MQKILIDENLSPSLAADAQLRGFLCSHVNHLGKAGTKIESSKSAAGARTYKAA